VRKSEQRKFLEILQANRRELLANARKAMTGDNHLEPDDFPDEIDNAASESGLAFIGRLRERERSLISKIDQALEKIEDGTYGTCNNCGEDIGVQRLRARPVASLCIDCKSQEERLER